MDVALTGGGKCAAKYEEKIYWKWAVTSECSSKSSPRRSHLNSDLNEERIESCANPATSDVQMESVLVSCIARTECWHLGSQVTLVVRKLPAMQESQETRVWSLGQEDPLEKEVAPHSSILAGRIPWREKSCGLHSIGSQRIRCD